VDNDIAHRFVIESSLNRMTNAPVAIPEEALERLTVAQIKAELVCRNVAFQSKLRKKALLDLLKDSLHLAVVENTEMLNKTSASAKLDSHPKQREEEKEIPMVWNDDHPARKLLYDEIANGSIPLSADEMGPAEVYCNYCDTIEFQMPGMEYGETFTRRLRGLREMIAGDFDRSSRDKNALQIAMKVHPPPRLNHKGKPQWNGSLAQALLKYDISQGRHETMTVMELYNKENRELYRKTLSAEDFRWKIQQEVRTKKYLYTLKYRSELKLKSNIEKIKKAAKKNHEKIMKGKPTAKPNDEK